MNTMNTMGMAIIRIGRNAYREARTTDTGFKVRTVIQYVRFYSLVAREHLVFYGGRHG